MALLESRLQWTYEDYLLLPEDGKRHEIIEGEHSVSPAPNRKHQRVVTRLASDLDRWARDQRFGEVYVAPFDVVFSELDIVQPDVLFFSRTNLGVLTEANAQGAPDLVVEVLSESTRKRDLTIKRKLYARYGVREYWVVDPELETVTVFRGAGELGKVAELAAEGGDQLESPLLPGLALPLTELFG